VASTIDCRLSTVCGFYRFAHIDGRINANPAQFVRRPTVHRSDAPGLDRGARHVSVHRRTIDHMHAALAVLLGLNGAQRWPTTRAAPSTPTYRSACPNPRSAICGAVWELGDLGDERI
jgi:hypothetical protein